MEGLNNNIQIFIKKIKKEKNFKALKIILSKHLLVKSLKIKDLEKLDYLYFITEIKDFIVNNNLNYNKLIIEINNILFENGFLQF